MLETTEGRSRLTRWAWIVTWATLIVGQLHALARFRTEDGKPDLDLPLTGVWAEPAGRALDPLLSWASPDTVYLTYGKWWLLALGVTVAAGYMVMRLRAPHGVELWGWRLMLTGNALFVFGAGAYYWGQWTSYNVLEDIGLWMDLPGVLLDVVGGTMLGIALLRRKAKPTLAAVLFLLTIPALFGISQVTSLGNTSLPTMFAIALLASAETRKSAASVAQGTTPSTTATRL